MPKFLRNRKILLRLLYILFFLSGVSALIYQITWQRLLTIHYGVGAVSITLIVSIYMLGLGLGALLGGYIAERFQNHVQQYFWVEFGVGLFGLGSFPLMTTIGKWTSASPLVFTIILKFFLLCIPTILMGMALPILIKIFTRCQLNITQSLSKLYFINTMGGAAGCLLACYGLISFYGIDAAIYSAAFINILLAGFILLSAKFFPLRDPISKEEPLRMQTNVGGREMQFAVIVFISGFIAIGYEIAWVRVIAVLIKNSPYAFASVLAVYLAGIAIGSLLIGKVIKNFSESKKIKLLYLLQVLLAAAVFVIFVGYYYLTLWTPLGHLTEISFSQPMHPPLHLLMKDYDFKSLTQVAFFTFRLLTVLIWPLFFIFVPTILIGATFPLVTGLATENKSKIAWNVGRMYGVNIAGNILGALITGFVFLPFFGLEQTLLLVIIIGLLFTIPILDHSQIKMRYALFVAVIFCALYFFPRNSEIYKAIHPRLAGFEQYFTEGVDGVVMTYVTQDGRVENFINGDSHGGRPAFSFYTQVLEAVHVAPDANNVLVIGYGTGTVTEAVLKIPSVNRVTVVELNRTLLNNLQKIPMYQKMMADPRIEFVIDDGRRFLQKDTKVYDLVFMSPLRAASAYSTNIYSQQFFELISSRLSAKGVFVVWSDSLDPTFRTLDKVFAYKRCHLRDIEGFFLASNNPFGNSDKENFKQVLSSFNRADQEQIFETSKGFKYVSDQSMRKHAYNYLPTQDWRPISEYYLGLWFPNSWRIKE